MSEKNVLMKGSDFCVTIPSTAKSIVFTETAPITDSLVLTNVDVEGSGSIVAWLDGTTYYVCNITGNQIFANEDCSYMFANKTKLETIDLKTLDTSNTLTMEYMFGHTSSATALKTIIFGSGFNTSKVTNMLGMFRNNRGITTIDVSGFDTSSCTVMERMFDQCRALSSINVSNFNLDKVTSVAAMFQRVPISSIDVSNWNVSNCTDFRYMFNWCAKLTTLNTSNWKTGKSTNFSGMFQGDSLLENLDVSGWSTENATDLSFMFWGCSALTKLGLENWDVSKVVNFDHFLSNCTGLTTYDISNWTITSACTNMGGMFQNTLVEYLDVSGWNTSNVINLGELFGGMYNLKEIKGLIDFNTANCINFCNMFYDCRSLKELDLSNFDTRKANGGVKVSTNSTNAYSNGTYQMFYQTYNLEKITLGENFTFIGDGSGGVGYLWTPDPAYINEADGYWYTPNGDAYASSSIPNLTFATYYASKQTIWNEDGKKYVHLAAMRVYHDLYKAHIGEQINNFYESLESSNYLTSDDIWGLFI